MHTYVDAHKNPQCLSFWLYMNNKYAFMNDENNTLYIHYMCVCLPTSRLGLKRHVSLVSTPFLTFADQIERQHATRPNFLIAFLHTNELTSAS